MGADKTVFIGIDPTGGRRLITYAILNEALHIEVLANATMKKLVDIVTGYSSAVCAIDAPGGPNKGLLADPVYRQRIGLNPDRQNYSAFRLCEYELRRRGIGFYNTPLDAARLPGWVKAGWRLYSRLREAGYVDYPHTGAQRVLEVHSHAAYAVLLKRSPYPKTSLEGRSQRQLILYREGVEVPDPMYLLEEWTHHRLLTGRLNVADIHGHDELDALVAAYVAFLAEREPDQITVVGDPDEGQIVVPTNDLQDSY